MSMDYWKECVAIAAEECGLAITEEQLLSITESVEGGHENYGMAFYSPPASDRLDSIDREWKAKYDDLQREFDAYKGNAEQAVKIALKQRHDANVGIGQHGEVTLYNGRSDRIQ